MQQIEILIIEDDILTQHAISHLIKEKKLPYSYIITNSVFDAREIITTHHFDLIILDYLLIDGTAFDIIDMITDTPIIFITGAGNEEVAVRAMRSGAYDYLIKDLDNHYLIVLPVIIENAIRFKQSEHLSSILSHAVRNISDSVYITNLDHVIMFANDAFCRNYGYASDEILSVSSKALYNNPDDFVTDYRPQTHRHRISHQRKDGSTFPVSLSRSVISNKDGKPVMIVEVVRDITEFYQAEQAIKISEERYRILFNRINDDLFVHKLTDQGFIGDLIEVNDHACNSMKFSKEELLAPDSQIMTPPENLNQFPILMEKFWEDHHLLYETFVEDRLGNNKIVEVNAHLFELDGIPTVLSIARDITERIRIKEALTKSEEKFRYLYETALVGMYRFEVTAGTLIMGNHTFLKLLGFSSDEIAVYTVIIRKLNFYSFITDSTLLQQSIQTTAKKGRVLTDLEIDLRQRNGQVITVLMNAMYYPKEDYLEGTMINITNLKNVERALRESLDEQKKLQEQVIQSTKMAGIGEMAAGMAHELNQPIAAMMSFAQSLVSLMEQNQYNPERFKRNLNNIVELSKKTSDIVNELRKFARPSEKDYESISMNVIIQRSFLLLSDQLKSDGIKSNLMLDDHLPLCLGNSNQLEQVVINLLSNAKDALAFSETKEIQIQTYFDSTHIVIEVLDTGAGISKENINNIFIPFFSTKSRHKGTGLGLSICYRIIKEHKGDIQVFSELGKGTTFKVSLLPKP